MGAGKYRHPMEIQAVTRTPDGGGGFTEAWATIPDGTVWAAFKPARDLNVKREIYDGQQLQAGIIQEIWIRYSPDVTAVTPANRLLFGSRVLAIRSVLDIDERSREMLLLCEELRPAVS